MRHSYFITLFVSILLVAVSGSAAWADVGPNCYAGDYERDYPVPICDYNPLHLSVDQCVNMCNESEYCKPYQVNGQTVFGGYWRIRKGPINACANECTTLKSQCVVGDQTCLARFEPQDYDCTLLTDEEDRAYCRDHCINNILTSECGRDCLKNGTSIEDYYGHTESGCEKAEYECDDRCPQDTYYCKSIAMHYDTKWSVFGVLMALLAALSGVLIFIMNRKNQNQPENKHS